MAVWLARLGAFGYIPPLDGALSLQLLPVQPDRFRVRYRLAEIEAEEAQLVDSVEYHTFDPFVDKFVHDSQDQDLEYRDGVAGQTPAFPTVAATEGGPGAGRNTSMSTCRLMSASRSPDFDIAFN